MIGLLCSLILGSCARTTPSATPEPLNFELEELLLDTSSLPSGWQVYTQGSYSDLDRGEDENQYREFVIKTFGSPVIHSVYLYRNKDYAAKKYEQYLPFYDAGRISPWESPRELHYQSQTADQFQFACANFQHGSDPSKSYRLCIAVGQYGRVVSQFNANISPNAMSYTDLEHIVKAIDKRMIDHLKK